MDKKEGSARKSSNESLDHGNRKRARSALSKPIESKRTNRKFGATKQTLTYNQRVEVFNYYHKKVVKVNLQLSDNLQKCAQN